MGDLNKTIDQAQAQDLSCLRNEVESSHLIDNLRQIVQEDGKAYFAFTIKNISKDPDGDLRVRNMQIMTAMLSSYSAELKDFTEEVGDHVRVHLHGIFRARKNLRYTAFRRKYWHVYIVKLLTYEDLMTWSAYMHKDDQKNEKNYYEDGGYHFVDQKNSK